MTNKRRYKTGEIYLVRFHPAVGTELKRFRPGVIISGRVNRVDPRFTLIAPLTTGGIINKKYEMAVKSRDDLAKESTLLAWYLRTVDVGRIGARIAQLKQREVKILKQKLKNLLEI